MKNQETSIEKVELALIDAIVSDQLVQLSSDVAETILDSILGDGVLQNIPVFGVIYKVGKAGIGIREQYFAKKVFKFLLDIKDISQNERQAFINDLQENTKQDAGEVILLLIDKLDSLEKPSIIANLLKAKIKDQITIEKFLRLSVIIERSFLPDLKKLHLYVNAKRYDENVSESLINLGLIYMSVIDGGSFGEKVNDPNRGHKYTITNLGQDLLYFGLNNNA
jgi:hypothetical protein